MEVKKSIKVGDYVRIKYMYRQTKIAKITKILEKDPCYHDMQMYEIDVVHQKSNAHFRSYVIYEEDILDYSSDIKELVYEGDYVNGYICRIINNKMCNFDLNVMEWVRLEDIDIWYDIVTKEDFEAMKYVIGQIKQIKG